MRNILVALVLPFSVTGASLSADLPEVSAMANALGELGPRFRGSLGYPAAQWLLMQSMLDAGLESVARLEPTNPGGGTHLTGSLSGDSEDRILLSAHYDTTAESSGLLDNASGCAVALTVAADLATSPLSHGVQLIFTDREEMSAEGSRDWLAARTAADLQSLLAHLDFDMVGGSDSGRGILHLVAASGAGGHQVSPAWLVHAILRAAQAVDFQLAVLDPTWSWFAQLAVRIALPTRLSDSRSFLAAGVPSVTLSDLALTAARPDLATAVEAALLPERLEAWVKTGAAGMRRLDGLAGPAASQTEYLVVGGRVFVRRDLLWPGFLLWVVLVWRGLPGRWRRVPVDDRRRRGRIYLPGFAFRMVFLLAIFLIPTFAALLLYPLAGLALVGSSRSLRFRQLLCTVAAMPTIAFILWLTFGQLAGWFVLVRAAWMPGIMVLLTLATYCVWQLDLGD